MSQASTASASATSDITDFVEWEQTLTSPQKRYHSLGRREMSLLDREEMAEDIRRVEADTEEVVGGWGSSEESDEGGGGNDMEEVMDGEGNENNTMGRPQTEEVPAETETASQIPKLVSAEEWYQSDDDPLLLGGATVEDIGFTFQRGRMRRIKLPKGAKKKKQEKMVRRAEKRAAQKQEESAGEGNNILPVKGGTGNGRVSKLTPEQKKEKKARKKAARKERMEREAAAVLPKPVPMDDDTEITNGATGILETLEQAEVRTQTGNHAALPLELIKEKKIRSAELAKKGPTASPFFENQPTKAKVKTMNGLSKLIKDFQIKKTNNLQEENVIVATEASNAVSIKKKAKIQVPTGKRKRGARARKSKDTAKWVAEMGKADAKMEPTEMTISTSFTLGTAMNSSSPQYIKVAETSLKRKRESEINMVLENNDDPSLHVEPISTPQVSDEVLPEPLNNTKLSKGEKRKRKRPRNKNKLPEIAKPAIKQLAVLPNTNAQKPKPKENSAKSDPLVRDQDSTGGEKLLGVMSNEEGFVQSPITEVKGEELVLDALMNEVVEEHDALVDDSMSGLMDVQSEESHQDGAHTSEALEDQDDAAPFLEIEVREEEVDDIEASALHTKVNPITPPRKVSVIIYTPTRALVPANVDDPFEPSDTHTSLHVPEQAVVGDDESIFNLSSHLENSDSDDSDDRMDDAFATPRLTRRASTTSTSSRFDLQFQLDHDPITYPRRHNLPAPQLRDKKGRFASTRSSSMPPHQSLKKTRTRAVSGTLERSSPSFSELKYDPVTYPRKTLSEPSTPIFRDKKGKFASRSTGSDEPIRRKRKRAFSTPVENKYAVSSHSSASKNFATRDSHGRFARRESNLSSVTQNSHGGSMQMERDFSPAQKVPDLRKDPDPLKYVLDTMAQIARDLEASSPKLKIEVTKKKKAPAKSPYFPTPLKTPSKKPSVREKTEDAEELEPTVSEPSTSKIKTESPTKNISCIPFPPLSSPHFGLIQEKLAHDPFRLLIAVTFLIRTHGKHAIPVFYSLISHYPTPESLISAEKEDIVSIIQHLGLQNQRAATYQMYAKIWLEDPPMKGKRYPIRGYPNPESGRDTKRDEVLDDDDKRDAWEIGHMTSGPYALDSWRIFCRDKLRGVAEGWNGEGNREDGFQPEWMRVLPEDKELRAYLRWMWLKEGFEWDPFTGEKEVASEELMRAAMEGRIAWDDGGGMRILNVDEMEMVGEGQVLRLSVDGGDDI